MMYQIVHRLVDIRNEYFEAKKRLAGRHPAWNSGADVRVTMFYKIANVLNCTQHGLVHLTHHIGNDEWWHQNTDSVPAQEVIEQQASEFDTFCKVGCLFSVFSMLESSLRQMVRTLDPTACSRGTAEFQSVYSWLLKRLGLTRYESLFDLLRQTRNTLHNNGHFFHRSYKDQAVTHNGLVYEFHIGKPVEFVTWDFILDRLVELRFGLEEIGESPSVAGCAEILEPST